MDALPDEYRTMYQAILRAEAQTHKQRVLENKFEAFRRKHPTYRK
jgi:hypothetical protein